MQVVEEQVEEQLVNKIRTLNNKQREDVMLYVDSVISNHNQPKKLGEQLAELFADIPDEVWEKIPKDGSEQHDHYIYGTPKR